jgi:serine/threonine protein kinase
MNQLSDSILPSSTVLFSENGTVKLGDFGLSKILEASQQQAISFVGVRIGPASIPPLYCISMSRPVLSVAIRRVHGTHVL